MTWTSTVDFEAVYAMRKSGKVLADVAAAFGITGERVRQICIKQEMIERLRKESAAALSRPPSEVTIDQLLLSVRTYNGLRRLGVATVAEVANLTVREVLATKNMGRRSLVEVVGMLEVFGLKLKEDIPPTIASNAKFCPTCGSYLGVQQ